MMALEGLKVLDFSRLLPGPFATWMLADMGADVTRIENPRELSKQAKVFGWDELSDSERLRLREQDMLARNKKSVVLDIGDEAAQAALLKLAAEADVVVEDYRPGVLAGLGLGYEQMRMVNPGLIYCSLTLCGQTGPNRDKPGHDPVALALAGALSRMGEDPEVPSFPGVPAADVLTGTQAAFAILAALHARNRDGQGQQVDIAMSDCSMLLLSNVLSRHVDPDALPPRGTRRADMGIWRTADDQFVCTTDMEPRYWQRFCALVGHPEFAPLQNDVSSRPAIRKTLEAIFLTKTRAEWLDALEAAGTQFAPVYSVSEALEDPHNTARGMVAAVPSRTGGTVTQLGVAAKLSRTPGVIRHTAHAPGADTQGVLSALDLGEDVLTALLANARNAGALSG